MASLAITTLRVRCFRNIRALDVHLNPYLNIFVGDNAQGKTTLLESVYVLATSRSFRTNHLADVISFSTHTAHVSAHMQEADSPREQAIAIVSSRRIPYVDGSRVPRLADYAVLTPAVVFDTSSLNLVAGPGAERRKLLDRLALYATATSYADALAYTRAVAARRRVLETRGTSAPDLDHWEDLIARHGHSWAEARARAAHSLAAAAHDMFASIAPLSHPLRLVFHRGTPEDAAGFRAALSTARDHDRLHRSNRVGRHKDEIHIQLGRLHMRCTASQGERRSAVLAMKLAEIVLLRRARGVTPLLLLDDLSSELDPTRMHAFLSVVRHLHPQVLLTTTRPELIPHRSLWSASDRCDYGVHAGDIRAI
jgi:DNA replication and repair protein RecF